MRIYIHIDAPAISLDPQSLPLFTSGFDLGRLACPSDELEHQAGEREQRSDLAARIPLGDVLELHHGGEGAPRDEFECPFVLRIAIMQAKTDLVPDRHHLAAAFHPLRLEGAWGSAVTVSRYNRRNS